MDADDPARDEDELNGAPWDLHEAGGPVLAAAVHAGHHVRLELRPWLLADEQTRLREEDPLTDFLLTAAGNLVRANRSRFEVDLNRPRHRCISSDPEDTWGLTIWNEDLPEDAQERSRGLHDAFYAEVEALLHRMIERHGRVLVLDFHSFNHRRDGPDEPAADPAGNPDIDLGVTELDWGLYGPLVERFARTLRSEPVRGRTPDVRYNRRFPDGGEFPEWVNRTFGSRACTLTLEYKKFFMDEWGTNADVLHLQDLRRGVLRAVERATGDLHRVGS